MNKNMLLKILCYFRNYVFAYHNMSIQDTFLPDSCIRFALGLSQDTSPSANHFFRIRRKLLYIVSGLRVR